MLLREHGRNGDDESGSLQGDFPQAPSLAGSHRQHLHPLRRVRRHPQSSRASGDRKQRRSSNTKDPIFHVFAMFPKVVNILARRYNFMNYERVVKLFYSNCVETADQRHRSS